VYALYTEERSHFLQIMLQVQTGLITCILMVVSLLFILTEERRTFVSGSILH